MTIAVTGSTGQLGRLVVARLKRVRPAEEIVAFARDSGKAADLGVPVREADYTRPETLRSALVGIHTLLLISSNEVGQRALHHRNVIEAAKEVGVSRIVYTSLLFADHSPLSLAAEHVETEDMLRASGIPFTILRNGWYTENYMGSLSGALAGGALVGSAGEGRISSATREDFADAAAAVVTGEGHDGKTYELAGDTSWTLTDLAAELSTQSGRTIPYRNLPESEYAEMLAGFGLPSEMAAAIASWDTGASKGALFHEGDDLSRLIGRPTTPLSTTVAETLRGRDE